MTLPITSFILERLLEYDPGFDTGAGVATTGLLVEPLAVILQPVANEISAIQASGSILTILESNDPDGYPEDIVDAIASNAFVERMSGQIGSTVERIRFFEPQAFSAAQGILTFRASSGQRFTNSESVAVSRAEMALNHDGSLYYIDVPIIALEEGAVFNVVAGSIITMEAEPAGVANLTNLFKVTQGRNRETNTELIARIKVAITVRALVTGRGIITMLTENFASIVEIEPIGFGDPEMMRDIVYNVHIGGNVDVYVRTAEFDDSYKDVFSLELDITRRATGLSVVSCIQAGSPYSLAHQAVNRTYVQPVVTTIDDAMTYRNGIDYTINDISGEITRLANAIEDPAVISPSTVFHVAATGASIPTNKTLQKTGLFSEVRPGMIVVVTAPSSVAGTYTIKESLDANTASIYGTFPGTSFPVAGVSATIDDNLKVSYEYSPVSIDIAAAARSEDRLGYSITDVPMMLVTTVEELDPLSGEPTGVLFSGTGGLGAGYFGAGGFGIGTEPDYRLVVPTPALRFSVSESLFLEFSQSFLGRSVRVSYKHAAAIPALQSFADDRNNQSQSASLLIKQFVPIYVDSRKNIEYDIRAADELSAISVDDMTAIVKTFIDNIDEGRPLELSDLVDAMYDNGAVEVDLDGLQGLRGAVHHHNGSVEFIVPSDQGIMTIPSENITDPSDKPLSPRISRFVANEITLSRSIV